MEIFFLLGRVLFGGYFILSGVNHFTSLEGLTGYAQSKKVPVPKAAVALGGILLLAGGAGILLGVFIPFAVLALALFLLPVSFKMHDFWNDADVQTKMSNQINFMKNMALLGAALMTLAIQMPWPFSI